MSQTNFVTDLLGKTVEIAHFAGEFSWRIDATGVVRGIHANAGHDYDLLIEVSATSPRGTWPPHEAGDIIGVSTGMNGAPWRIRVISAAPGL